MKRCAICGHPIFSGAVVHKSCVPDLRSVRPGRRFFRVVCKDGFWRVYEASGNPELTAARFAHSMPTIYGKGLMHEVASAIELDNFNPALGPWEEE